MADTVTAKLGLTKPEVGASNNTWGTKVNGNMDILEAETVRQTIQWTITGGDDNNASTAGPWQLTRWNNSGLAVDNPISVNRQTGVVNMSVGMSITYEGAAPASPPAGSATIWFDGYGNPYITRPDGTTYTLGTPPGTIVFTPSTAPDAGWAVCNGQAIPRASNPYLFSRIGTYYGAGDGSTTFNIPDIRGRVVAGVDNGVTGRLANTLGSAALGAVGGLDYDYLTAAQIPPHTHGYSGSSSTGGQNQNHNHNYTYPFDYNPGVRWFDAHTATTYGVTQTGIENQTITHNYSWGGNTDTGAGVAGSWHPNVQPTICLTPQIKLG